MSLRITREDVIDHFVARSSAYDRSSSWCTDEALGRIVARMAQPLDSDVVLDVACGTGLVSKLFKGRVAEVVGIDITAEMAVQSRGRVNDLVIARAESLPFTNERFDVVVCRQGIQFMLLPHAIHEMDRVLKPGGRLVLVNLCAYGDDDRDEYFEILRLRNPVRRHFFVPEDLDSLLREANCDHVELVHYISPELIDDWSDNGAIDNARREAIRVRYRAASPAFGRLHAVEESDGQFVDHMLFVVAAGMKA